ncbi:protein S100-A12 [Sarcophilus harrisii]|uniref:EF-hand domain-containing protein n=1 Tax=Sarcophilus harrisii TaxID=9305 RepID=G3W261_SARHA|nr:protein S100-A12 [Sarcophilus harrisii]
MVTKLEGAVNCLVTVFHKYSLASGHYHTLSKDKFRKLLETEIPEVLKNPKDPKTVEKILKEVDSNKDGMINFEEFLFLATRLLVDAHDATHE